ncbi:hypothetical protein [Oceanobacillus profundus]|nr:hypothetical protein [Oceanobacillus profundus]
MSKLVSKDGNTILNTKTGKLVMNNSDVKRDFAFGTDETEIKFNKGE